eukprot:152754-Chlamydomonas_euryale.AAC.3
MAVGMPSHALPPMPMPCSAVLIRPAAWCPLPATVSCEPLRLPAQMAGAPGQEYTTVNRASKRGLG